MRILLVEDERGIADFVERALRAQGHAVEIAGDGAEGEHRALAGDPDLVILDVMLPGRNGVEVLREIRGAKPALPVIMLTARAEVADKVAGLDAGRPTTSPSRSRSRSCWRACARTAHAGADARRPSSAPRASRWTCCAGR